MCKFLKIHYEETLVPNENGGFDKEKIPYADECMLKNTLCPDCVNCKETKKKYKEFINSTVTANR